MNTTNNIDFGKMYLDWLKQNIDQYSVNDHTFRITLPFSNRNNDMVEMYIIDEKNGNFKLTDDGITISDLKLSGFDYSINEKRKVILQSIITAYGVIKTDNDELVIKCTLSDLSLKIHMLAQCIIKISDLLIILYT
jgi:hypothetical protein